MRAAVVTGVIAFIAGAVIFSGAEYEPAQVIETREVSVVETVEVEVPTLSGACADAVQQAHRMYSASSSLSDQMGRQIEVMSKSQQAITVGDFQALTNAEVDQRNLQDETRETFGDIASTKAALDAAVAACIKQ